MRLAAEVGLSPPQFWDLTFREFVLYVEGRTRVWERHREQVAWHAANLMNAWGVKPKVTVDRLLKRHAVNNDAVAAMIGDRDAPPRSKKQEAGLVGTEKERKKDAFRKMMRRKTAEAKAAHAKKKAADAARRAGER